MKLVADANILFSIFWKDSFTKRLIVGKFFELVSPEFCLEEINSYKTEIIRKTKISEEEFFRLRKELILYVDFISLEEYSPFLEDSFKISFDFNDVDYLALAIKLRIPIWTNDKDFKKQKKVKVFNTTEVMKFL